MDFVIRMRYNGGHRSISCHLSLKCFFSKVLLFFFLTCLFLGRSINQKQESLVYQEVT